MSQLSDTLKPFQAVPFYIFVLICDRDAGVSSRSALAFQKILTKHPPGRSDLFYQMLDSCQENYQTLWREYSSSTLRINLSRFLDLLNNLKTIIPRRDYEILRRDLAWLAYALFRGSHFLSPHPSQKKAYSEFIEVLQDGFLPPHALDLEMHQTELKVEESLESSKRILAKTPSRQEVRKPVEEEELTRHAEPSPKPVSPAPQFTEGPGVEKKTVRNITLPLIPEAGAVWTKGHLKLVCVKITDEAKHVKTFSFASPEGVWFRYQPGQFVTIEPFIDGKLVHRSYTISSTPTRPGLLQITVKRITGGLVSNWLHDNMRVGLELGVRGPAGKFTCINFPREKYLLISAGSGITPLMSMLRYFHDLAATVDVVFFYWATSQQDIIFHKELALYMEQNPHFRILICLTREPEESSWVGLRGRIDNEMLHRAVPDFLERMILGCGPTEFMEKAKQLFIGNNFPMDTQFDEESFTPPKGPKKPEVKKDGAQKKASGGLRKIIFVKSHKTVEVSPDETILEAAERCGVEIPNSCRKGSCGTCRVTKLSGEVIMAEQEALSHDEIAQGDILTCVGQPKSPVIEVEI